MLNVYPSPVASLHDRACQIFFEIMGGLVDYGEAHSSFHAHSRFGRTYEGLYPEWSEDAPITIVAHSLGCPTARVLQYYPEKQFFKHSKHSTKRTSASWVSAIIAINAPFNGAIRCYTKGMNLSLPPLVDWGSQGHLLGVLVHVLGYLDIGFVHPWFDLDIDHWSLSRTTPGSLLKLLQACLGYCVHSNTDNISWDASIHGQLAWSTVLQEYR